MSVIPTLMTGLWAITMVYLLFMGIGYLFNMFESDAQGHTVVNKRKDTILTMIAYVVIIGAAFIMGWMK